MGLKPRNPEFQCVQAELVVPGSPQAGLHTNAMKTAVALFRAWDRTWLGQDYTPTFFLPG